LAVTAVTIIGLADCLYGFMDEESSSAAEAAAIKESSSAAEAAATEATELVSDSTTTGR